MAKYSHLSFAKGEFNKAFSGFFRTMLDKGIVDSVFVLTRHKNGIMPALISGKEDLGNIDPFAPVAPVNTAKLLSSLTAVPAGRPVAAVVRSCEVRALIELVKLKQANLDDLVLIGIDCLGRYENTDYAKLKSDGMTAEKFLSNALSEKGTAVGDTDIANACKMCEYPVPDNVDIRLGILGAAQDSIIIEWIGEKGEAVLEKTGLATTDKPTKRDEAIDKLTAKRIAKRDEVFADFREKVNDFDKLTEHLEMCVNCYNCRVACPVCYCKECVFVTDTFRHNGDQYFGWADKHGTLRMPTDTLFYHLVRLAHMSTLCVGCGQCSSACPNDIELAGLFRTVAQKTQAKFDYQPGKSVEEMAPLSTFHDNEFLEITKQNE